MRHNIVTIALGLWALSIAGQQTLTWTGLVDTDWHKKCNWSPMQVPTCQDTVIIPTPSSGNYPVISGIAHCRHLNLTTPNFNALTITPTGRIDISSGGGVCNGTPTDNAGSLSPTPTISGPSTICANDTGVWKAPYATGLMWTWTYPSSWQLVTQAGDSIVLIPDNSSGYVTVEVCDNNCNCGQGSVFVQSERCGPFCLVLGTSSNDEGSSIIQTADKGFLLTGYTGGNRDLYVAKLSGGGTLQWTKIIGGSSNWEEGKSLIQTRDGGYIIAGYAGSFGQGWDDVYVVKLDVNGNVQWTKTIGGTSDDKGFSIIQTTDGGYAIAGYTTSFGQGSADVYVIKLDAAGNVQWTRTIGGPNGDYGRAIVQTSDGGYVIAGHTNSFCAYGCPTYEDVYVVKLDANGNLLWTKTIGGADDDRGYSLIESSDGGIIITGNTYSYGRGNTDIYIIKLSNSGNLIWVKTVGGTQYERARRIISTSDGGFAIVGHTSSFGSGGFDIYLIKMDAVGNLQWTRTIGGSITDDGQGVYQTADGGYAIVGFTSSFCTSGCPTYVDIYVIRLDRNGNLPPCPGGCQVNSGGTMLNSLGPTFQGGSTSSGGLVSSGGTISSGGTLLNICP